MMTVLMIEVLQKTNGLAIFDVMAFSSQLRRVTWCDKILASIFSADFRIALVEQFQKCAIYESRAKHDDLFLRENDPQ